MKGPRLILLLYFCTICASVVNAQNTWVDSLKKVLPLQKEDTGKVGTLIRLCEFYMFSHPDTASTYGQAAFELSDKLNFDDGRLGAIINLNIALFSLGNYTLEMEYAIKLIPLAKRMNSIYATGFSNGTVGDCYQNLGEYDSALKYYKVVLNIGIENHLPELHRMYSLITPVFIGMKQWDSAMWYAQKGYELLKLSRHLDSNSFERNLSESVVFLSLARAYAGLGKNDSALKYYRQSIPPSETISVKYIWLEACIGVAAVFKSLNNPDSAKSYATIILNQKNLINPIARQKAATLMAEMYEVQGVTDSALHYLHLSVQLRDSMYNQVKLMNFQRILANKNEKERAVIIATKELQNRYRFYLLIGLFLAAAVITGIIIRTRRARQLQGIRNSIADDLHDDIGSTLSSISIMNELAKERAPEALPLLNSIGESTAMIQETMSDIVWAINPYNDHFENLLQRMQLFSADLTEGRKINFDFVSDPSLNDIKLSMKQRKNIYLFFKEAINNAVKHSCASSINVVVKKVDKYISIQIVDNGKGFQPKETYPGNGMKSLGTRAAESSGEHYILSEANQGTTVHLQVRVG